MPALRIATAGAALVLLTAGSTVAQPTAPATGKPISLLKIFSLPDKTKNKPHNHRLGTRPGRLTLPPCIKGRGTWLRSQQPLRPGQMSGPPRSRSRQRDSRPLRRSD